MLLGWSHTVITSQHNYVTSRVWSHAHCATSANERMLLAVMHDGLVWHISMSHWCGVTLKYVTWHMTEFRPLATHLTPLHFRVLSRQCMLPCVQECWSACVQCRWVVTPTVWASRRYVKWNCCRSCDTSTLCICLRLWKTRTRCWPAITSAHQVGRALFICGHWYGSALSAFIHSLFLFHFPTKICACFSLKTNPM